MKEACVKRILVAVACLFVVAAHGAPTATTYDVEILIFENKLPDLEGGELWTHDNAHTPRKPEFADATVIDDGASDATFTAAVSALERNGSYRVLLHRRWRQAAEEKSATKAMRLRDKDGTVDGTLRFYTNRFLLVDLDVVLRDKTLPTNDELNYRLSEHRRVKPQEMNYFDHPKLGVLLRVVAAGKEGKEKE